MTDNPTKDAASRLADRLRTVAAAPAAVSNYAHAAPFTNRAERKLTFKAATLTLSTGEKIEVIVKNLRRRTRASSPCAMSCFPIARFFQSRQHA